MCGFCFCFCLFLKYEWDKDNLSCHLQVVTPVVWNKPDIENSIPLWIIILAILAGLLLLGLLIYVLYRVSTAVIWKNAAAIMQFDYVLIYISCISEMFLFFFLAAWLLQASGPVRHRHGESTTQTAGCLRGLNDHQSYQDRSAWAIWLQRRIVMEHVEWIKKKKKKAVEELRQRERLLELHCAALEEDKTPKISKPNECFLLFFLIYVFFAGRVGLLSNQTCVHAWG